MTPPPPPPSASVLITSIRNYTGTWTSGANPSTWTTTAEEFLAKPHLIHTDTKKLVANNSK
ncbi:hypothetical protein [Streptomyces celluloflavus]|uniref:hypothetical protein n=1 Tax=Streptomyces celluloflavus TaxID=58344 RepID=UPI0036511EDD